MLTPWHPSEARCFQGRTGPLLCAFPDSMCLIPRTRQRRAAPGPKGPLCSASDASNANHGATDLLRGVYLWTLAPPSGEAQFSCFRKQLYFRRMVLQGTTARNRSHPSTCTKRASRRDSRLGSTGLVGGGCVAAAPAAMLLAY